MNINDPTYSSFSLVQEMMDTVQVIRNFDTHQTQELADEVRKTGRLFLAGEGSSRLFPAKNLIRKNLEAGTGIHIITEGCHQAAGYDLSDYTVFLASNSGRTKEVLLLAEKLSSKNHPSMFSFTSNPDSQLKQLSKQMIVYSCGQEKAVAATKSVVEQALLYESVLWHLTGVVGKSKCEQLSLAIEKTLTQSINPEIIQLASQAPTLYFAGYNDGVAEELTTKTNETVRKKSDFLEGTYAVHGIEEVMHKEDIVFWIDPIEKEIDKFMEVLVQGVGLTVIAISEKDTPFPTIRIPQSDNMTPYVCLCTGWNLLVEVGLTLDINLDKPVRARKVGNEMCDPILG